MSKKRNTFAEVEVMRVERIFIIEDDVKIRNELKAFLEKYGYECMASDGFDNVVDDALSSKSHLILLDITLPLYDGYHICREIRRSSDVPIIMVTSRDSDSDELMSMTLGADDFITKPYNTQVLLAHIQSVLKRAYHTESSKTIEHKGVVLDVSKSLVRFKDRQVDLTKNELRILYILMDNRDTIISRDDIMSDLWQSDEFVDDNTLTVNINRLRKKLEGIGIEDFLITKRGQGYMV